MLNTAHLKNFASLAFGIGDLNGKHRADRGLEEPSPRKIKTMIYQDWYVKIVS